MCTIEEIRWDLRIILNLDPLIIGIYFDMGIKQGYLINPHLLISSRTQALPYASTRGRPETQLN